MQHVIVCFMKKWTLKFKLLYLLNHKYYFNKKAMLSQGNRAMPL